MPTNNIISRTDAAALIPEDVSSEIVGRVPDQSAAFTMFRRVPMSRAQQRVPVLSALPIAYWVNGDTGQKQTTEVNWANKYINAEELACIVPIPEAVLDDVDYDVWAEIQPLIVEAIGRTFDAAAFFGTNAPASFPSNINTAAAAAGNNVTEAATAAQGAFFGDVDAALALLEADGFDATGYVAARTARGRFRASRNAQGDGLDRDRISPKLDELDGDPIAYSMRGLFPSGGGAGSNVRLFAGEWTEFAVGIRQDITYKILDQAVIQDQNGDIQFNLAQQDMVAMRCVFRGGWQVSNVVNYDQPTEGSRYPAAVVRY